MAHSTLPSAKASNSQGLFIRRIRVERLFGRYTYDLKYVNADAESSRILILYGDNGSGKTTILRLIFNLLTHIDNMGHKTVLAETRARLRQATFLVYP
jgi:ABC-type multidrug transport system ATPase subunit